MPKLTRKDSTCLGFRSFISRNHAWRRCQLEHIDRIMDLLSVAVDRSHAPICIGIAGKSYTVDKGKQRGNGNENQPLGCHVSSKTSSSCVEIRATLQTKKVTCCFTIQHRCMEGRNVTKKAASESRSTMPMNERRYMPLPASTQHISGSPANPQSPSLRTTTRKTNSMVK